MIVADNNAELGAETVGHLRDAGGDASFVEVDLADDASVQAAAREVIDEVGSLDMLVNNAAILRSGRIEDGGWIDNWEPETAIGLRGWVLMTQALLPALRQTSGSIVNISSEGGFLGRQGQWVYDAIKAALVSVTKTMAAEFVGYGIRVNAVAPGWVVTEMHFGHGADAPARKKQLEESPIKSCIMKRTCAPAEIASAVAFLLSEDASYMTGTTIHVDGGRAGMSVG